MAAKKKATKKPTKWDRLEAEAIAHRQKGIDARRKHVVGSLASAPPVHIPRAPYLPESGYGRYTVNIPAPTHSRHAVRGGGHITPQSLQATIAKLLPGRPPSPVAGRYSVRTGGGISADMLNERKASLRSAKKRVRPFANLKEKLQNDGYTAAVATKIAAKIGIRKYGAHGMALRSAASRRAHIKQEEEKE